MLSMWCYVWHAFVHLMMGNWACVVPCIMILTVIIIIIIIIIWMPVRFKDPTRQCLIALCIWSSSCTLMQNAKSLKQSDSSLQFITWTGSVLTFAVVCNDFQTLLCCHNAGRQAKLAKISMLFTVRLSFLAHACNGILRKIWCRY